MTEAHGTYGTSSLRRIADRAPALCAALVLLLGLGSCSRGTAEPPPAMEPETAPETAGLPPTPTFTPSEAAFAANIDPLTGLPSEIEDIARRPLMAYAIEWRQGTTAPEGIEAVELVVEHPPDPANPSRLRLTALSRLQAGERPNLGPLGSATALDLDIARAFGADLTVLSLDPALDDENVVVTRLQAPQGDAARNGVGDSHAEARRLAPPTAAAGVDADFERAPAAVPWTHASGPTKLEPQRTAVSSPRAGAWVFDTSTVPDFAGEVPSANHWTLDPVMGTWVRLSETTDGFAPVQVGEASEGELLRSVNLLVVRTNGVGSDWRWVGGGSVVGSAGERMLEGLRWARSTHEAVLSIRDAEGSPARLEAGTIWITFWPEEAHLGIELRPTAVMP